MAVDRVQRRMAAILAADVVGYSRLMGDDEAATLAALKAHRKELIDGTIAEHKGRIVKLTGDGMLVEFPSVVNAVACAAEIQRRMAERNADCARGPAHRVPYRRQSRRHHRGGRRHLWRWRERRGAARGHRASRAASRSQRTVRDHIGKRSTSRSRTWASRRSRTSSGRCGFISVLLGGPPAATNRRQRRQAVQKEKPSIAVLPFTNMSGDAEQEYFADGITEDIITDLSKVSGLSVIARNSVFAYKGTACRRAGGEPAVQGLERARRKRAQSGPAGARSTHSSSTAATERISGPTATTAT